MSSRLMKIRRLRTMIAVGGTVVLAAAVASAVIASRSASPVRAADVGTSSGWLATPAVQHFSAADSVDNLAVLVSAGSAANGLAVVTGANEAGETCWTLVQLGGAIGSDFRCGTPVGSDVGNPNNTELRVVCQTSGGSASSTADAAGCLGFVASTVASVSATLGDGSTQQMNLTDGAFAYAASTSDELPTSFTAFDANGQAVGHEDVSLSSGLGNG